MANLRKNETLYQHCILAGDRLWNLATVLYIGNVGNPSIESNRLVSASFQYTFAKTFF